MMKDDVGRSPLRGSGSRPSDGAACSVSTPDGASIPNASELPNSVRFLKRLLEADIKREGETASFMVRAGLLRDILYLLEAYERDIRIQVWNRWKTQGAPDRIAYKRIEEEIARLTASAIEAATADETRSGSAEGESAVLSESEADAQTTSSSPTEGRD